MNSIVVKKATKIFKDNVVLKDISFTLESGTITGIIGRNGSGKTVLIKCICGFIPLTGGHIYVDDKEIGKDIDIPNNMGIIVETPGFLPNFSGRKNLEQLAMIHHKISKSDIEQYMTLVGLDYNSTKKVGKYSLGMRQRLGIAQAIMEDPDILLLDEPLNGLDNESAEQMRKIILSLKEKGKTILLASHNQNDIDILCDRVFEIDRGHLYAKTLTKKD
jgi:ABC-2 type transport system ATP-binding protein